MKDETRLFISSILITVILFGAFGGYSIYSFQKLNENLAQMQTETENTLQALQENMNTKYDELHKKTEVLSDALSSSVSTLESSLSETKKQTEQKLFGLEGKLSDVQEESRAGLEGLEDKLVSLNLKSKDFSIIIDDVIQSVISIRTDKGRGSGVIVHSEGYAVTNYHVLDGVSQAAAIMYNQEQLPISLIAVDKDKDLALIQLYSEKTFESLAFDDSFRVGERVIALGSPAGLDFSVTEGIISAVGRVNSQGVQFIQTDVPINPGNSGGPLVNIKSKIVGINTMKTQGFEGLGFAIEAGTVGRFVREAIASDQND